MLGSNNEERKTQSLIESISADSDDSSSDRKKKGVYIPEDDICVEIYNSEFYFLIKNKVCKNDDNSIYDNATNKMFLVGRNGRRLWNGVMIGKIMVNLRKETLESKCALDFPVLDPVLSSLTDSNEPSWIHFNWSVIQRELKKFGAEMINQVKELIIHGEHEVIRDVLKFLMNFEKQIKKEAKNLLKNQ